MNFDRSGRSLSSPTVTSHVVHLQATIKRAINVGEASAWSWCLCYGVSADGPRLAQPGLDCRHWHGTCLLRHSICVFASLAELVVYCCLELLTYRTQITVIHSTQHSTASTLDMGQCQINIMAAGASRIVLWQ